jgi:hypothetical protein
MASQFPVLYPIEFASFSKATFAPHHSLLAANATNRTRKPPTATVDASLPITPAEPPVLPAFSAYLLLPQFDMRPGRGHIC